MTDRSVGIIGVGLMGHAIAMNIQRGGWRIGFLDHPGNQPSDDLVDAGATVFKAPRELAVASDVIILCVTGTPQVEEVLLGESGVVSALKPGTIILDCSTSMPGSTVRMARLVAEAGGRLLDAPMTRTPKEAAEGRLNLLVGGDCQVLDDLDPLLKTFAERVTHVGQIGSGHTLKLVHNFVSLGFCALLAEAGATARKAGIEPRVFYEVLTNGGGRGVALDRMSPFILNRDASGFQFSLSNSVKDTIYIKDLLTDLGSSNTMAAAVSKLFVDAVAAGHGDAYIPELIDIL